MSILLLGLLFAAPGAPEGPARVLPTPPSATAPAEPSPAEPSPPEPSEPPALVPPVLQNAVRVEYPPELLEGPSPPEGEVIVKLVVGTDGVPKELFVETGLHPELDALALEAAARLRYQPGLYDGEAVEIGLRVAIAFTPPPPPPPRAGPPPTDADATTTPSTAPASAGRLPPGRLPPGHPDAPVRIVGTLLEAGQRTPIEGARVLAVAAPTGLPPGRIKKRIYADASAPNTGGGLGPEAWSVQALTDANGRFELRGLPDGNIRLSFLTEGHERLEYVEALLHGEELSLRYFQTRDNTNPYRTVVRQTKAEREEVARRTITRAEINAVPGTQGDALKAIQNFPGVARSPFGFGFLVIRGAAPSDSATYLAHHEIPQLFHFGGLTSVFNSDILEQIDFIPGNFDARFGDAIGGVVNVVPRKGRRDGYHGYIDSDLFDTGILLEGPVGKGSFILSGRRSYIDFLLPRVIPDDAGLNFTLAPRYYDYQAIFDYPIAGGNFTARLFGSDDKSKLVSANPNDIDSDDRNRFENALLFHRADLSYRKTKGPWEFLVTPSYRYDAISFAIGDFFRFNLNWHIFSGRAELSRELTKSLAFRVGTEFLAGQYTFTAQAPPVPNMMGNADGGAPDKLRATETVGYVIPALYSTLSIDLGPRFTLYPGVRFAYYSAGMRGATTDPRLRFAWRLGEQTTLKGGAGLYSQQPEPAEIDRIFGNPRLRAERASHFSLGLEHVFERDITVEATAFYKYLFDLATNSSALVSRFDQTLGPENFASQGQGRIFGLELLMRKALTKNWFGWLSYTVSRSERRQTPNDPWVLFDFDQTHILTLISVLKLPKGWQIGGRFRLISGNPTTPVIGSVADSATGSYIPIQGLRNSDRLPMFHQLDLRVDKLWTFKRVRWSLYLDVLNIYNHQNTEFWNYSFDYSTRAPVASLPILPSLGTKLEF